MIRRRALRRLIRVCTVCQCPSPGFADNPFLLHSDFTAIRLARLWMTVTWISYKRAVWFYLFNDNHVNNNLKAILVHVNYSSIVNSRSKNNNKTTNKALKRAKNNEHRNQRARTRPNRLKRVFLVQKHYVLPTLKISAITWENGSFLIWAQQRLK